MVRKFLLVFVTVLALIGFSQPSQAFLSAVDPGPYTAAFGFFPQWYEDTHGLGLDLCLSTAAGPNGPLCVLLADPGFDPALAIAFPGNFPSESFYFVADAALNATTPVGNISGIYRAAIEATFATGAVTPGGQITFARIRYRITLPVAGPYTVTHPYGVDFYDVPNAGTKAINFTNDVGVGTFTGALDGDIGPFLTASTGLITVGAEQFIGDPNITQTVVGSPFGTNFVRIQGPGGIDVLFDQFTLGGKVTTAALPTPAVIERTTYSSFATSPTTTQTQIDVFVTSAPAAVLSFADSSAVPVVTPMGGDPAGNFFGQVLVPPATLGTVTITASNPPNVPVITAPIAVTDVVTITRADYSHATGTLIIEASSSDETVPPTLSYEGNTLTMTATPPVQAVTVSGLIIPPARVTVTSSAGGSHTEEVVVLP